MKINKYLFTLVTIGLLTINLNAKSQNSNIDEIKKDTLVFVVVEESPEFQGGDQARIEYLIKNINYPKKARKAGIQGTVYITFIIEKDGKVSNVRILRGIGGGCDDRTGFNSRVAPTS
jgi:Na+-translocating ferredoxin:NAD+ oxidoreductase RnfG subunit